MYSDTVLKIINDVNQLERQLITDFGVDDPVRLVNTEFQKRFKLAQTKYNLSLSFPDKSRDLKKMASMMLRAWQSLQEQLLKEGVMPLPVDTWKLKHTETDREVFICKDEAGKKNVQKQFGKYVIVLSADELLNMIDHDIFLEFVKLTKQGLLPTITSYKAKTDEQEKM
tara:strand:- start:1085 stop:1591 length:507 start_codon:yes stop_codon:yes gene_type:complete